MRRFERCGLRGGSDLLGRVKRRPGAKAPCICWVFRRAEALRSLPKSKTNCFSAKPVKLLVLRPIRKRIPNATTRFSGVRLFFCGEALGHDGGVEAFAQLVGDLVDLFALVDLDGLLRGVEDDLAVLAPGGVGANLFEQFWAESLVEVVGKMA